MERMLARLAGSPLKTLKALDASLKRERRVLWSVTSVLILATLVAALLVVQGIETNWLRLQSYQLQTITAHADEVLQRRGDLLTEARLVLARSGSGSVRALPLCEEDASSACRTALDGRSVRGLPRSACNDAMRVLPGAVAPKPIAFIAIDGSAACDYGMRLASGAGVQPSLQALAAMALRTLAARRLDMNRLARHGGLTWVAAPPEMALVPHTIIGIALVERDAKPYALVMTSVTADELAGPPEPRQDLLSPTLIGADGAVWSGSLTQDEASRIDEKTASMRTGVFEQIGCHGWVFRSRQLVSGLGHYLLAVPWHTQLALIRTPLLVVFGATVSLIVLLLAVARYWNHGFLTRTYREASRALEGELLNHLLVHATPVGLCIVRRHNFEIVIANQMARDSLGLDRDATRLPACLCQAFEAHDALPPLSGDTAQTFRFTSPVARVGGAARQMEVTCAAAMMNREDVLFCAIADMSQHFEAEQLLREAKRTSEEAARAKVRFFASTSHEIGTPLASLVGNIELLALGPLTPEQQARVEAMQLSSNGLLQIVNDVLDFAKIDFDELRLVEEWASVAELLEGATLAHAPLAQRQRLKLYLVIDRNVPATLLFDTVRLSQIVNNLLGNALKFTPSGKIVLRARWVDHELEISVTDSGVGISDEMKEIIFLPFRQGSDHRLTRVRGTGLGLAICVRLCRMMNGRIELDSTLRVGTRMTVTLPLREAGTGSASTAWTLPAARAAILCQAAENEEWLTNLFDPAGPPPLRLGERPEGFERLERGECDYLLVTDEFSAAEVALRWSPACNVIWLLQNGPLVPIMRDSGGVELNIHSVRQMRAAVQMVCRLSLSAGPDLDPGRQNRDAPAPERSFAHVTVLIAEDNLLNRGLLRDQLRTRGAHVLEARDGEEALAMLDKHPADLVLTDLDMPVMNGYELLGAARERHPELPVYAISANTRAEDIDQAHALGFTGYLSKPVSLASLTRVLDALVCPASRQAQDADEAMAELAPYPPVPSRYKATFIEQTGRDLAALDEVLALRDPARLDRWAHGVGGGLSVLGPSVLHEACKALRDTVESSREWNEDIRVLAEAIGEELKQMSVQVRDEVTAGGCD